MNKVLHMEIRRDHYLEELKSRMGGDMVKVIAGVRRCGNRYLLFKLGMAKAGKRRLVAFYKGDSVGDVVVWTACYALRLQAARRRFPENWLNSIPNSATIPKFTPSEAAAGARW